MNKLFLLIAVLAVPSVAQKPAGETKVRQLLPSAEIGNVAVNAVVDPKDPKSLLITVDLSGISILKSMSNLRVPVEFYDAQGKLIGKESFGFTDTKLASLPGGKKYSRSFEYGVKNFPPKTGSVKVLPATGDLRSNAFADRPGDTRPIV